MFEWFHQQRLINQMKKSFENPKYEWKIFTDVKHLYYSMTWNEFHFVSTVSDLSFGFNHNDLVIMTPVRIVLKRNKSVDKFRNLVGKYIARSDESDINLMLQFFKGNPPTLVNVPASSEHWMCDVFRFRQWIKQNCRHKTNIIGDTGSQWKIYFQNDKEAVAFKLKFG